MAEVRDDGRTLTHSENVHHFTKSQASTVDKDNAYGISEYKNI